MALEAGMIFIPLCFEPISKFSSSAQGVYSVMSNISSFTTYPSVINALKELDIEASVRILDKMIKELNIKNKTKTIDESIMLLKEVIMNIENELNIIHQGLAYNATLYYLKYFRSYNFKESIEKIRVLKIQLDNRTNIFFKVLRNNNELTKAESIIDMSIIEK